MKNLPVDSYNRYQSTNDANKDQAAMDTFLELMEIQNFQAPRTEDEFQSSPLKAALESLRVNGKPMFNPDTNPVTFSSYRSQVRDAMDQIAPAMLNPNSSSVPYVQSKILNPATGLQVNGPCKAIIPAIPRQPIPVPEKPAWYKRLFKGIVPSWRQEVNTYQEAKQQEKTRRRLSSYIPVLEERAQQRQLQSAVQESRSVIAPCNQQIEKFFGVKPDQIKPSKLNGMGFTNVGRENVPMAFALGIMMAEKGIDFDQALLLPDEEKRVYGKKAMKVFADFKRIGESMHCVLRDKVTPETLPGTKPFPLSDDEQKMYVEALSDEFREKVAPYIAMTAAAYGSQTILPIDPNDPESIRTVGQRNQILTSLGQGLVQMYRNSLSATNPDRFPFRIAYGQVLQNQAAQLHGKDDLTPYEQALLAFASPAAPQEALSQQVLAAVSQHNTVAEPVAAVYMGDKTEDTKKALDAVEYSLITFDGITRANSLSILPLEQKAFNSVIEGKFFSGQDELVFGTETLQTVFTKNIGLQTLPQELRSQYNTPFFNNAYVKKEAYDLYAGRYSAPPSLGDETLFQLAANPGKSTPETVGLQDRHDADQLESLRRLERFESMRRQAAPSPSRQQTSLDQLVQSDPQPARRSSSAPSRERVPAPSKERSQLKQPLL